MKNLFLLLIFFSTATIFAQDIIVFDDFTPKIWHLKTNDQSATEITPSWVDGGFESLWVDNTEKEIYIGTRIRFDEGENGIFKMDLEGNLIETINNTDFDSPPRHIIVDKELGYIYYVMADGFDVLINRMDLNGANIMELVSSSSNINGLTYSYAT